MNTIHWISVIVILTACLLLFKFGMEYIARRTGAYLALIYLLLGTAALIVVSVIALLIFFLF